MPYSHFTFITITLHSRSKNSRIPSGIWSCLYGCASRWAAINRGVHDGLWLVGAIGPPTHFFVTDRNVESRLACSVREARLKILNREGVIRSMCQRHWAETTKASTGWGMGRDISLPIRLISGLYGCTVSSPSASGVCSWAVPQPK